jgi:hypothetical protein
LATAIASIQSALTAAIGAARKGAEKPEKQRAKPEYDTADYVTLPTLENVDECPFKKAKKPTAMDVGLARACIMEALDVKGSTESPKELDKFIQKVARAGLQPVCELYTSCGGEEDIRVAQKVEWVYHQLVSGDLVPI